MPGPLPTLPADVLGRIACAAMAAEGITKSLVRLSLVCCAWRDILRRTVDDILDSTLSPYLVSQR